MDISTVINQVLMLFIPVVLGWVILKIHVVEEPFIKNLSAFIFNVTLPCSIVSALQVSFNKDLLIKSIIILFVSVSIILITWLLAEIVVKLFKTDAKTSGVLKFALVFSNFSFMGYPVAKAFMGETGLFYATIFSLPLYAFEQSLGIAFIDGDGKRRGFKLKYILNPPMVGVVIGFSLFLSGLRFPAVIGGTLSSFGTMTTPLAMVLVGMNLSRHPLKESLSDIKCYIIALARLVAIPLLVYSGMTLLGFGETVTKASTIITMMPVAANIIIVMSSMGKDSSLAARVVLVSTLLSVITIPLMGIIIF